MDNQSAISDIHLSDSHPMGGSLLFCGDSKPPQKPSPEWDGLLRQIVEQCRACGAESFRIMVEDALVGPSPAAFRGQRLSSINGVRYLLRKMPISLWSLKDIGVHPAIRKYILDARHTAGGLMLVSGSTGAGKSTTLAAIAGARLKAHGGVALTVEDPPEMPLEGSYGQGICYQQSIPPGGSMPPLVRSTLRGYPVGLPAILLIGEVRDAETASLALRSALDGRLVLTTFHANSAIAGISRFIDYAGQSIGRENARSMFSEAFRLVMHQRMKKPDASSDLNRMAATYLIDTQPAASIISSPDAPLNTLKDQIRLTHTKLKTGARLAVRKTSESE